MNITQQKRLLGDIRKLKQNPLSYYDAYQDENDPFLFYFLFYGQHDTPYEGGQYIGIIKLVKIDKNDGLGYPFKPPDFYFLTPNGKFEINKKICLSISGYHKESWDSNITIYGMLTMIYALFVDDDRKSDSNGLGFLRTTVDERKKIATKSVEYNITNYKNIYSKFDFEHLNDGKKNDEITEEIKKEEAIKEEIKKEEIKNDKKEEQKIEKPKRKYTKKTSN